MNSPMAMKCCTKLETAKERCPIVFQGHPSNFKVTRYKTSPILTQIGRFRTIGRSQLSNPSDLPCYHITQGWVKLWAVCCRLFWGRTLTIIGVLYCVMWGYFWKAQVSYQTRVDSLLSPTGHKGTLCTYSWLDLSLRVKVDDVVQYS